MLAGIALQGPPPQSSPLPRVRYGNLSRNARDVIRYWYGDPVTIAGYVRFWFGPERIADGEVVTWRGDTCGCPDDRCIGYHHDDPDDCHCLPETVGQYAAFAVHGTRPAWMAQPASAD